MSVKVSDGPVPIDCGNQGGIKLIISRVDWQRMNHIDVQYHHVYDEQSQLSFNIC